MKKSTAVAASIAGIIVVALSSPILVDAVLRASEDDYKGPTSIGGRWWWGRAWIEGNLFNDDDRMEELVNRAWAIDEGRVVLHYDISFTVDEHLQCGRDVREIEGISNMALYTDLTKGKLRITVPRDERDHLVIEIHRRFGLKPNG